MGRYPVLGYPHPDLARVPHPRKDTEPVEVLWVGDGVTPQKGHGTSRSIMGWRWVPPEKDMGPVKVLWDGDGITPHWVWSNKQAETIIFPHPLDAGGNK